MLKRFDSRLGLLAILSLVSGSAVCQNFDVRVPMKEKSAATFYVDADISGFGNTQLMVDTGSGFMTINEKTLASLMENEQAEYRRELSGILANGDRMTVPVYSINRLAIGSCEIFDVEAAVFPGNTRQILGLSALTRTAPFIFSTNPAELVLTCQSAEKIAKADDTAS